MTTVDMKRLRNVVLAGHSDSGKTTLAEHLLHTAGAITRLGKVTEGTASLDFEPEEQKRKQSLSLALVTMDYDGHEITLVDTPGYADFAAEDFVVHADFGIGRFRELVRRAIDQFDREYL